MSLLSTPTSLPLDSSSSDSPAEPTVRIKAKKTVIKVEVSLRRPLQAVCFGSLTLELHLICPRCGSGPTDGPRPQMVGAGDGSHG